MVLSSRGVTSAFFDLCDSAAMIRSLTISSIEESLRWNMSLRRESGLVLLR